ncbi:hypothetical protein EV361DRAFT_103051 [Lentinula raphanica]|uniref:Uncharacterized protein n=1 Tax=Lentinula raphanica TaxID=153919 RepID=A0AA38UIX9_9AGAR|nr:hypothetical protein F5880DRAFT_1510371 [Lentinula raphanica]KAJ3843059.1 hypothetical protein F5878DRAFT_638354 [Lentinula raphanica]KAJ3964039.1 hypothetical protein EV361DRAFT_103051 [Lentinula raphanica]
MFIRNWMTLSVFLATMANGARCLPTPPGSSQDASNQSLEALRQQQTQRQSEALANALAQQRDRASTVLQGLSPLSPPSYDEATAHGGQQPAHGGQQPAQGGQQPAHGGQQHHWAEESGATDPRQDLARQLSGPLWQSNQPKPEGPEQLPKYPGPRQ